jgi:endogenous inhibitor of DNA gyrase (YacG/DUF329 family)
MLIVCPECGIRKEVPADHAPRPFCSPQCKLLDLGRWLNEEIRLPVSAEAANLESSGQEPEN